MITRFVLAVVVGVAGMPRIGAADEPARKPDPTADLLAKLRKPVEFPREGLTLGAFVEVIEAKANVSVVVNEEAFQSDKANVSNEMVKPPRVKTLPLAAALRHTLAPLDATFLVRKGYIEIVPVTFAVKEVKQMGGEEDAGRLLEPLVSAIYKEKPINEALADLAEEFDLSIVVAPQSGDNKTGFVSARLLNVPADKAIELLTLQADLRVIRKGNAFFVTGRDHANDLANERLDREQRENEVERARTAPFQPPVGGGLGAPAPVPAPAPPAPPAKM